MHSELSKPLSPFGRHSDNAKFSNIDEFNTIFPIHHTLLCTLNKLTPQQLNDIMLITVPSLEIWKASQVEQLLLHCPYILVPVHYDTLNLKNLDDRETALSRNSKF